MINNKQKIISLLQFLYGEETGIDTYRSLGKIIRSFQGKIPSQPKRRHLSQKDAVLITYGDMLLEEGKLPFKTLCTFLMEYVKGLFNTIHILPFFPYSSDDGFSVIDYKEVNRLLGDWKDIEKIRRHFNLMFDLVINHISAKSGWFNKFIKQESIYQDYFISVDGDFDFSKVFRPRTNPLLSEVQTQTGKRFVWTTFSSDQIDLNFKNPQVLLEIIDVLLFYVIKGANVIRLDAIAYIWKESGTNCIHLPQAHAIVQLMRAVLDEVAPHVMLITETNVPHQENISYFGDGNNEAQMVYNFSLPPLVLHAFQTQNANYLTQWAQQLTYPSEDTTFFNFLASHDGIGVTPAKGILADSTIYEMAKRVERLGGRVSYKTNEDGSSSPYELNINYLDALADPSAKEESISFIAKRFITSQAIMLALKGVPGIYFHSLVGSRSWLAGVEQTGQNRTINRQKIQWAVLRNNLQDQNSLQSQVYKMYKHLLVVRAKQAAFHPNARQKVLDLHPGIFALLRASEQPAQQLLCLQNVTEKNVVVNIDLNHLEIEKEQYLFDIINDGFSIPLQSNVCQITLNPYQVLWLEIRPL